MPLLIIFHIILQKAITAPVGVPSALVKLFPLFCEALSIAKYALKINVEPSIRNNVELELIFDIFFRVIYKY
jgi:hypothetical protein